MKSSGKKNLVNWEIAKTDANSLAAYKKLRVEHVYTFLTSIKPAKQLHIRGTNLDCLLRSARSFSWSITNIMTTYHDTMEISTQKCNQQAEM